jgi:3-methylcrotonyl-CoA carboxylase alpha subunit
VTLGQKTFRAKVLDNSTVLWDGKAWDLRLHDPVHEVDEQGVHGGNLTAPMPGAVVALQVKVGDLVNAGDALMIVVAMKMEHTITAPHAGEVKEIYFQVGDQVKDGDVLLSLEQSHDAT